MSALAFRGLEGNTGSAMPECPDDNLLIQLAHGGVSAEALVSLEAHLDGCASCRTLVAAVAGGSSAADPRAPIQVLEPGERMGRYEIERLIGAGGMGVLYVAKDTKLDRRVALKLMRPHYADEVGRAPTPLVACEEHPWLRARGLKPTGWMLSPTPMPPRNRAVERASGAGLGRAAEGDSR